MTKTDRPRSKMYLASLLENIQLLEQRLREACQTQSKQQHQQRTHSECRESAGGSGLVTEPSNFLQATGTKYSWQTSMRPYSADCSPTSVTAVLDLIQHPEDEAQRRVNNLDLQDHNSTPQRSAAGPERSSCKKSNIWTVIYGPDRLIYDKEKGRIDYFSPATCYKNYVRNYLGVESWHVDKRSYRVLADVPAELDTYLMEVFWNRYNNTLGVIDQKAFSRDQANGGSTYYSAFLHLVCLAMGFRFANRERRDIQQVTLNDDYSLFQREAKYVLDYELESPRGLTTIQAILVLSDVECAYGRDDLATIYIGISCRLAFDFGLNLDCSELGLSEAEMEFRNKLLRSCIIYDRAWALYLGRPTYMKLCDISSSCLNKPMTSDVPSHQSVTDGPSFSAESIQGQILDALIDLSELCSRIQEVAQPRLTSRPIADENRLMDVAALDTKLKSWYSTLPSRLKWTLENIGIAPPLFFIMHQQYLVSQIILHGPYGHYEDLVGIELDKSHVFGRRGTECSNISLWRRLARAITMDAAMKIAQGFASYRKRFGICETSVLSLQQGGTAFLALMCNIKASRTTEERNMVLRHLYILMEQLQEMSDIFSPAKVMCSVVRHEMAELRIDFSELLTPPPMPELFDSGSPATRGQRASSESLDTGPAAKRRRLNANCQSTTTTSAQLPSLGLDRSPCLPAVTLAEEPRFTDRTPPTATSSKVHSGPLSVTFPADNFEPLNPISDLSAATSSWPMDFSDALAPFDGQSQDQATDDNQLLWLPESHLFDGVDSGLGTLYGAMQSG